MELVAQPRCVTAHTIQNPENWNFSPEKFVSFRKNCVYLQCQTQRACICLQPPYAPALATTYIKAFSERFDSDDVRTSQTPITCHKSKQRKRPMRCIYSCNCVGTVCLPLLLHLSVYTLSWGFRVARFSDRWAMRRPLHREPGKCKAPRLHCLRGE